MPVEFIGIIPSRESSESRAPTGPLVDLDYIGLVARAHEYAKFDRALYGYHSSSPDGFQILSYAAQQTKRLKFLLAHRPGFLPATIAARNLASLDQVSGGRLAVHIITGGDDADQRRDGDFLSHDERYARTEEFLEVIKRFWKSSAPFDHDGKYYKFENSLAAVKPAQEPAIPIYFGGSSDVAIEVAAKHADVYALFAEPLDRVRETVAKVRAAAARYGRQDRIRFSMSVRPIVGATEAAAWARADDILAKATAVAGAKSPFKVAQSVGMARLREVASNGRVHDQRLWTELSALPNARGSTAALVGSAEQVVESLLNYHEAGITTFLIRGFEPVEDALLYGRELLPAVRAEVARRDAAQLSHGRQAIAG